MLDLQTTIIVALAGLAGAALLSGLFAWCFRGWLELKRAEFGLVDRHDARVQPKGDAPTAMNRIEVADLKERVRRLEAIAAGVDL